MSVTYLASHENEILGYVSILADKVECKRIGKKGIYPSYPAIKIGRLSVDKHYQNLGIGSEILLSICIMIKELSKDVGISFITIDAYCSARKFYLNNSFEQMNIKNPKKLKRKSTYDETTSIPMYKEIEKIKIN